MPEVGKRKKRSEEDVTELLQRYSASTIISLLQEVSEYTSKHPDSVKIDWSALVKNTSAGISNAREYQMLWRHLAYYSPLLEKIEEGAEPLDDDSDLECELEVAPALSPEEIAEAKECAKVILSSGAARVCGSTPRPAAEAPLSIDIPNEQTELDPPADKLASSTCGGNNLTPVSNQKPPLSTAPSAEGLDGNGPGSSGLPAKKKRQLWTKEEDMELIAAVQKCGEGNWANILKGDFKHNRTASQLSQRWALIRKRQGSSNPGNANKTSSSARSEERLAAQKAFSLAVDMPMTGSLSLFSGGTQMASSSPSSAAISQASRACAAQSLNQSQDKVMSSLLIKARPPLKKPSIPVKPLVGPNPLIQAAAFAAGGRIANPSTAASLFKAAQSKNAVHIRPLGGGSLPVPSTVAGKTSPASNPSGLQSTPQPQPARPSSSQPPPVSFGTTLSSQRSSQPGSVPLVSCTTASESSQPALSESKQEAVQCPNKLDSTEGKNIVSSDISSIGVEESLTKEVGGNSVEMRLASAMKKEGQMIGTNAPLSSSQVVVRKDEQLQKEAVPAPESTLVADSGGTQIDSKELKEIGTAEDGHSERKIGGDRESAGGDVGAAEVKDPCLESATMTKSKSPDDGQSANL